VIDVLEDETFLHSRQKKFDVRRLSGLLEPKDRDSLVPLSRFSHLEVTPRPTVGNQMVSTLHKEMLLIIRDPMLYTVDVWCIYLSVCFLLLCTLNPEIVIKNRYSNEFSF